MGVASLNCDQPPREKTGATNSILHHHTNSKALTMEDDRLWKFSRPEWLNSAWARNPGVYGAGALFSIAFYVMLDSAVWSHSPRNASNVHVHFVDWLPLIFSSLGMLIINSVEKQRLSADSFSYSGNGVAWKARVVLFLGFAMLAGGMAGGVVTSRSFLFCSRVSFCRRR